MVGEGAAERDAATTLRASMEYERADEGAALRAAARRICCDERAAAMVVVGEEVKVTGAFQAEKPMAMTESVLGFVYDDHCQTAMSHMGSRFLLPL